MQRFRLAWTSEPVTEDESPAGDDRSAGESTAGRTRSSKAGQRPAKAKSAERRPEPARR